MANYNTVVLQRGPWGINRQEGIAGTIAITPGMLLEFSSGVLIPHATANGAQQRLVALESQNADSETLASVDVPYASGDVVYYTPAAPGDLMWMWIKANETAVAGVTPLASGGGGLLQAGTIDGTVTLPNAHVGVAVDAFSGTVNSRIRVRIL